MVLLCSIRSSEEYINCCTSEKYLKPCTSEEYIKCCTTLVDRKNPWTDIQFVHTVSIIHCHILTQEAVLFLSERGNTLVMLFLTDAAFKLHDILYKLSAHTII